MWLVPEKQGGYDSSTLHIETIQEHPDSAEVLEAIVNYMDMCKDHAKPFQMTSNVAEEDNIPI